MCSKFDVAYETSGWECSIVTTKLLPVLGAERYIFKLFCVQSRVEVGLN